MRKVESEAGEQIHRFFERVQQEYLSDYDDEVEIIGVFSEIEINIHKDSHVNDLAYIYYLKHEMRRKEANPYRR
jgi:hypothetical protein